MTCSRVAWQSVYVTMFPFLNCTRRFQERGFLGSEDRSAAGHGADGVNDLDELE